MLDLTHSSAPRESFVAQLVAEARQHRAVNHGYLQALASPDALPDPQAALADFGRQYLAYSQQFSLFLVGVINQLPDEAHQRALRQNLLEEQGLLEEEELAVLAAYGVEPGWVQGIAHPLLFRRFLDAMGVEAQPQFCAAALRWRDQFLELCSTRGPAAGVGALGLGTEAVVRDIYRPILVALDRHTDLRAEQRVFFTLHALIDDEHGVVLERIAAAHAGTEEGRAALRQGCLAALALREAFFDQMWLRAQGSGEGL